MKTTIAKYRNVLYGAIAFAVLLVATTVMLACQRQNEEAANRPQAETTPEKPVGTEQQSNIQPTQADQLNWTQIQQNMGGPTFPQHFRASVTGGALFLAVINTANGNGGDLAFLR